MIKINYVSVCTCAWEFSSICTRVKEFANICMRGWILYITVDLQWQKKNSSKILMKGLVSKKALPQITSVV